MTAYTRLSGYLNACGSSPFLGFFVLEPSTACPHVSQVLQQNRAVETVRLHLRIFMMRTSGLSRKYNLGGSKTPTIQLRHVTERGIRMRVCILQIDNPTAQRRSRRSRNFVNPMASIVRPKDMCEVGCVTSRHRGHSTLANLWMGHQIRATCRVRRFNILHGKMCGHVT